LVATLVQPNVDGVANLRVRKFTVVHGSSHEVGNRLCQPSSIPEFVRVLLGDQPDIFGAAFAILHECQRDDSLRGVVCNRDRAVILLGLRVLFRESSLHAVAHVRRALDGINCRSVQAPVLSICVVCARHVQERGDVFVHGLHLRGHGSRAW